MEYTRSVGRSGGQAVRNCVLALVLLSARPSVRVSAQVVDELATRLAGMTAVTGLEQAMTDSLLALLPGSARDRAGNVTLTLGRGAPKRLIACPLDEVGYVVGNITAEGYLTLRRVGGPPRIVNPLFDQQLEGQRVTVFGARGPIPGVVAVKSTHLTRGRPSAPDVPFTVDEAYVDVGAASPDEVRALGIAILSPVSITKRPYRYADRLLAAPVAGQRAACAALAAAVLRRPRARGTVVVAFTVQSLWAERAGLNTVLRLQGPFDQVALLDSRRGASPPGGVLVGGATPTLTTRYPDTAVETVSLAEAAALADRLVEWMGGGR